MLSPPSSNLLLNLINAGLFSKAFKPASRRRALRAISPYSHLYASSVEIVRVRRRIR